MELSRDQALSILGLSPSATDDEAARAYTRQKQPIKRMLVRADSVSLKNEYRDRLRTLVLARDVALGRTNLDDRTRRLKLEERPLLESLDVKDLDRARAYRILGLTENAGDGEVLAAYTERYRFLTQRLGRARKDEQFREIRNARVRLLGVRRFLFERTETLDLTAVFANEFEDEPFDPEKTRTSLAPELPDEDEWEGGTDHIQAHFERLVQPLREHMAAAETEELKQGYEGAIAELERNREEALRRHAD